MSGMNFGHVDSQVVLARSAARWRGIVRLQPEPFSRPACRGYLVRLRAELMPGLLAGTADIQPSESTTIINASSRRCCRIEPSIAVGGSLARHFLGLIHRRDLSGFDQRLDRAHNCVVPELRR